MYLCCIQLTGLAMGIHLFSIARIVITTVTVAHVANARPSNVALCSCRMFNFERFQVTLSHKYLYSASGMISVM